MKLKIKIDERIKKRQQKIAQRNIDKAIAETNATKTEFNLFDMALTDIVGFIFIDIPMAVLEAMISGM